MSTIATLILVQQYLTRYALSTIVALGNLGNLISIGVFLQKKHRKDSCSIYLLSASAFGLIAANWAIVPIVYALDHFSMVNSSLVICRLRGYMIHVNSQCFRYTLVLMCIDRYALCNTRVSVRSLCRPQIAYRSISILIIFWMIATIHVLIWESIENNRCYVYGIYGQIFSFYILIFTGIIPISVMIFFSILMMKNLRQLRVRVQPFNNTRRLNGRDISLTKVVLIEVIVYIFCTLGYPLINIYTSITDNMSFNKTTERKQIESFISFMMATLLLYLNYNTTFYVHIFTSKTYRTEVKKFILKLIGKLKGIGQTQNNPLGIENQIRA